MPSDLLSEIGFEQVQMASDAARFAAAEDFGTASRGRALVRVRPE